MALMHKSCSGTTTRALTGGEWQVDSDFVVVDMKHQLVYFMGTKDSPLEKHLYVASFAEGATPEDVVRYCIQR